jgi:hypothetical protein
MSAAPHATNNRRSWKVRLLRFGVLAAVCYVGVIVVLLFLENWLLYRPSMEWVAPPPGLREQDIEMYTADGTRIHAWWCPTANWDRTQGAVVYCHGNAGNVSQWAGMVVPWQRMGEAMLLFDYPGYGRSGGKPSEAGCYAAADAAYDWLVEKQQVPADKILLVGVSLGGGVATDLASRRDHRALVLLSTFTSIPEAAQQVYFWLPARWLVHNQFDNLKKIGQCRRPVFVAHGTADRLLPFSQGERLFAAANEPKQFFPMNGHAHGDPPSDAFYAALSRFLAETAPKSPEDSRDRLPRN